MRQSKIIPDNALFGQPWAREAELARLTWSEALKRGHGATAQRYLTAVLERSDGEVSVAAEQAGVERESFYRLLRRYGLSDTASRAQRGKKTS